MSSNEMRPCPFCGRAAARLAIETSIRPYGYIYGDTPGERHCDAVTVLVAVQATPGGKQRNDLLDKAEEYGRLREESDERAIGYAEKVNKIWGGGCNE